MKKAVAFIIVILFVTVFSAAQEKKDKGKEQEYKLTSEKLDQQGKDMDAQIAAMAAKMADIIKKYDLLKNTDIRLIPYQTKFVQGPDYIEMEKYSFKKDDIYEKDIVGIQTKKIKVYTNGQTISKIESEIYDHNYWAGSSIIVRIVDPSPMSEGTDDVLFTHIVNGKVFLENKKLGEIKNSTAYPIRNELKREFLLPHVSYFANSFLFIAEMYYKGMKDAESGMFEFLKGAKKY